MILLSVSNPDVMILLPTVKLPPINADSFTPKPPCVRIEPVPTLLEFVVDVTLTSPLAVKSAIEDEPFTVMFPPIFAF